MLKFLNLKLKLLLVLMYSYKTVFTVKPLMLVGACFVFHSEYEG